MSKYKTTHKMYSAWNYEREIEDLNRMSERGWQLVKGGMFSSRFKQDESVQYRYQLDFQPMLDDRPRYVENFREFGWEYINSTANGWHYFRKPYDPTLPEDEYEIFTDRSSLREMNNRWAKLGIGILIFASIVTVIELVFMIMNPMLPTLILLLEYVILLIIFIRGVSIMKNPDKSKSRKGDRGLVSLFLISMIACLLGYCVLTTTRANMECKMSADYMDAIPVQTEEAMLWNTIDVKYPDFHYISLDVEADSPMTFTILNEAGETVYNVTGNDVSAEDTRVFLRRGEYKLYISDFDGGAMNVTFDLD